jgi:uncharacterized peroxidase-related enzyme
MDMVFRIHNKESAPDGSRRLLANVERSFGFIPNILGILAEAPAALEAYVTLTELVQETSFSPLEQQAILAAVSSQNGCDYCTAAHAALLAQLGAKAELIDAIRSGHPTNDRRLDTLVELTRTIVSQRGWVSDAEVERFLAAGFTRKQVLELLVGVVLKTLSNYANHMAHTPLDRQFLPFANRRNEAARVSAAHGRGRAAAGGHDAH